MLVFCTVNGRTEAVSTKNMTAEEICKWLEHLRTRSGVQIVRLVKPWHTDTPSIQGTWHTFLNKDPSLATTKFPALHLYQVKSKDKSATEIVLEESLQKKVENTLKIKNTEC